jgi:hypothetical protein
MSDENGTTFDTFEPLSESHIVLSIYNNKLEEFERRVRDISSTLQPDLTNAIVGCTLKYGRYGTWTLRRAPTH